MQPIEPGSLDDPAMVQAGALSYGERLHQSSRPARRRTGQILRGAEPTALRTLPIRAFQWNHRELDEIDQDLLEYLYSGAAFS